MPQELKRGFGYWTILALSVGAILGTTLFFGIPFGARHSGNLLLVAWVILSLVALYIAAIFGELSAMFPKAGGAYEFSKQAYGKFPSFVLAWTAWMFGSISAVIIIIAAVGSLGLELTPLQGFIASVALIILLNAVTYVGIEASSFMLLVLGAVMIGIPLLIIAKGLFVVNPANFQPFLSHPVSGVFVAIFFMAEAYFGWESATYLAEETKNPEKNIPRALVVASALIGIIGFLMILVSLGMIPWQQLQSVQAPFNRISEELYGGLGSRLLSAGVFLALLGTAASTVLSMPRLLFALARDRLFLGQFRNLHSRFKTPSNAVLMQTVVLVLLLIIGFASYEVLLQILVPMAAILYVAMILAVPVLRRKMPLQARPFRVPFARVGPAACVLIFAAVMAAWLLQEPGAGATLRTSLSLILVGMPLYFLVEMYYDPKMITGASDLLAYANFLLQKVAGLDRGERKKVVAFLGSGIRGKTVLDYGCGVGGLVLDLVEAVGRNGKVYATHFSKNSVRIARKRVEIKKWHDTNWIYGEARIMHDPKQMTRVHPDVGYAGRCRFNRHAQQRPERGKGPEGTLRHTSRGRKALLRGAH